MKVLLADDSAPSRRLVEVTLANAGHEVTAVADGEQAVAAFASASSPLVILDWLMPNVDGIEACRRIRELPGGAEAFVLMVTSRDASGDLVAALGAGVDDYVMKPVTAAMILSRVLIAERRIALDARRREAEAALANAQRLAGIGETTLALQHEINNPLAALLMRVQLLAAEAETPSMKEECEAVSGLARRIASVVRRLQALEDPKSVAYLGAARMIDLGAHEP